MLVIAKVFARRKSVRSTSIMAARIAQFSTTVEMIDPGSTRRSIGGASLTGIIALAAYRTGM